MSTRLGLKFAMYEHRWENRTNSVILVALLITTWAYVSKIDFTLMGFPVTCSEIGIVGIILIGFCHLIARMGHMGEQIFMNKNRPWRK